MSAISAYKRYGVAPSIVNYLLQNNKYVPTSFRDTLSQYFLLYRSAAYITAGIKEGRIMQDGTYYHVVFIGPLTLHRLRNLHATTQVAVSYRQAQPEYALPAYAVIYLPHASASASNATH